jgi:hypothetical protein
MTHSKAKNTGRLPIWWGRQDTSEPTSGFVEEQLDEWLRAGGIARAGSFAGSPGWGGHGENALRKINLANCEGLREKIDMPELAPHDLRRVCAGLCHASGGELEQVQFLLGHVSVQTTERYLGCKHRIRSAVNDRIGIEENRWVAGVLEVLPTIRPETQLRRKVDRRTI